MKTLYIDRASDIRPRDGRQSIVLCGRAVFAALASSVASPPDRSYVEQPSRSASARLFGRDTDRLRVWIARDVLDAARRSRLRPSLSLDHYLRWGFAQPGETLLIGGFESESGVDLEIFAFRAGRLIGIDERRLSARDHRDFSADFDLALTDLKQAHRGYRAAIAAPLAPPFETGIAGSALYIGEAPFARSTRKPLNFGDGSTFARRYGPPALIGGLSVALYAGAIFGMWEWYRAARDEFAYIDEGIGAQFDDSRLTRLQAQRGFLDKPPSGEALSRRVALLTAALANENGVSISKLFVKGATQTDPIGGLSGDANIAFEADLPAVGEIDELERIAPILSRISAAAGGTLRLLKHSLVSDNGRKRLKIVVEGIVDA